MDQKDLSTNTDNEENLQLARVPTALIWSSGAVYLFVVITGLFYKDWELIALTLAGCAFLIIPMVLLSRRRLRASGLAVILIELATVITIAAAQPRTGFLCRKSNSSPGVSF